MAGLKVVSVKVLNDGSLDLDDLRAKAEKHKDKLAAFMVSPHPASCFLIAQTLQITYPSTFGVFEDGVQEVS
jgi:glycine dehydrogenase